MDTKITLSFEEEVIKEAKAFARSNNISLSRLTEFLYRRMLEGGYKNLEELPISDWVDKVSEGKADYLTRPRSQKKMRDEFYGAKE